MYLKEIMSNISSSTDASRSVGLLHVSYLPLCHGHIWWAHSGERRSVCITPGYTNIVTNQISLDSLDVVCYVCYALVLIQKAVTESHMYSRDSTGLRRNSW